MNQIIAVFIGGGIGSLLRFGISKFINSSFYTLSFPLATFLSNIISCALLSAFILFVYNRDNQNDFMRLFVLVGICGGLSTFSTFSYETIQLLKNGNTLVAVANIIVSVSVCVGLMLYLLRNI
jgi:CrcB protein